MFSRTSKANGVDPGNFDSLLASARDRRDYQDLKMLGLQADSLSKAAGVAKMATIPIGIGLAVAGLGPAAAVGGYVFASTMKGAIDGGLQTGVIVEQDVRGQLNGTRYEGISQARTGQDFVKKVLPEGIRRGATETVKNFVQPFKL